ncbi:MAG: flippase [Thermoplasmatales archaeon]|nr:MAG: flippase [Thermoplasmatales archaeon]
MIARKSALIVATNIINGALAYVALFFITRYMEPDDYGIVAFAMGFVALFTIFGRMGFDQAHIKKMSEGKDPGICIGTFFASKIGLIGLMTLITLVVIFFWKAIMGRGFETSTHELAIYIMMGYWAIKLITESFITTFRAKKEIAKANVPIFLGTLIRVAVTIYVAVGGFGAIALAFTYISGEIAYLLSALYLFRIYPIKRPTHTYFKDYSKFAFPLVIVVSCSIIMTNIDKVLIQLFWDAADVGFYFAAFRLTVFINMFTLAIGTLLFPTFSMLHADNNIEGIRRLTFQSERYLSMIIFPIVLGMVVLAEPAVFILLSGWMPVVPILQILPFFVLLAALGRPHDVQIVGMGYPKLSRNRVLIMVCFNVVLNIILIPKDIQMLGGIQLAGMGAKGAAIATVISYGIGLVYNRIIAWKLTKVKVNPRILLHGLAAGVMATILYNILYTFNMIEFLTRWYHLLAISLLGLGIYLVILFLFKEFTKIDFHFFIDTLNIKKMIQYIRKELKNK